MQLQRSRRRATACGLVLAVLALSLPPAEARPQRDLGRIDLRIRPGDLKFAPSHRPLVPYAAATADEEAAYALAEQVEATDRARRSEIPDRRRDQNLLDIGSDGSFLEELLENQTIPLFWVTVEPPF